MEALKRRSISSSSVLGISFIERRIEMIYWKKVVTLLKARIPQLEDADDIDDILFICYCDLAMSIKQIAELCEVSSFTLREKLLKIGLKLKKRGGPRRKRIRFLRSDLEEMSIKELCTKYHVSKTTVEKARRRLKK
jgi:transposase